MDTRYSKTGIASAVIGTLNIAGLIIFLLYINYSLDRSFDPDTIIDAVFGSILAVIIFLVILFAGFLTGIISLFQQGTKKLFGVLGLLLSLLSVLIFAVLILMLSLMSPGM
jgi:uncharacterized membrane protein